MTLDETMLDRLYRLVNVLGGPEPDTDGLLARLALALAIQDDEEALALLDRVERHLTLGRLVPSGAFPAVDQIPSEALDAIDPPDSLRTILPSKAKMDMIDPLYTPDPMSIIRPKEHKPVPNGDS